MKLNQWAFLAVASVVIIYAVKVYAGTVTLQTYYPAPTGYYDNMKINKVLRMPCYDDTSGIEPTVAGAIWIKLESGSCS